MLPLASAAAAAPYITGAIAALAIVGSFLTTGLTLRHQRLMAEEERLSSRRADTYIRLLEHQHQDPDFRKMLPAEIASRILAYGSVETNEALQTVRSAGDDEAFAHAIDTLINQVRRELQGQQAGEVKQAVGRWQ
jgi:hypothetical protein